jgi:hypothetical protein
MRPPRVLVTDKLASYSAAKDEVMPSVEHRRHKGLYGDIDVKVRVQRQRSSGLVPRAVGYELIRGELTSGRGGIAPRACIRWASWGPNHDAAMRIGGEAPGRRVQSEQRLWGHSFVRRTATSDHPRQLTTRTPMSSEACTSWTAGAHRS